MAAAVDSSFPSFIRWQHSGGAWPQPFPFPVCEDSNTMGCSPTRVSPMNMKLVKKNEPDNLYLQLNNVSQHC